MQLLYSRGVLFVAGDVVKGQAEADEETSNKDRIKMAVGKDLKVLLSVSASACADSIIGLVRGHTGFCC